MGCLAHGLEGSARIVETDATVNTQSGEMKGCIVVEETFPRVSRMISWYCPGVGLAQFEEYAPAGNGETLLTRIELLGYGRQE